jgi:hypothetical protein
MFNYKLWAFAQTHQLIQMDNFNSKHFEPVSWFFLIFNILIIGMFLKIC